MANHQPRVKCTHEKVWPEWDSDAASKMTSSEIRKRFPRFDGVCPDCKEHVIVYASFEQYVFGDY